MKEQNIAKVYALSFIELALEKNIDIASELTTLTEVINASNDLENVLFLDVFTAEEKILVLKDISKKINLAPLVVSAVEYLVAEKRMNLLPLITKEIIVIDDNEKGFLRGTIEGSLKSIDESDVKKLSAYIKSKLGKEVKLNYVKSNEIASGFKVTVGDLQLDASLDGQLENLKQSILGE